MHALFASTGSAEEKGAWYCVAHILLREMDYVFSISSAFAAKHDDFRPKREHTTWQSSPKLMNWRLHTDYTIVAHNLNCIAECEWKNGSLRPKTNGHLIRHRMNGLPLWIYPFSTFVAETTY